MSDSRGSPSYVGQAAAQKASLHLKQLADRLGRLCFVSASKFGCPFFSLSAQYAHTHAVHPLVEEVRTRAKHNLDFKVKHGLKTFEDVAKEAALLEGLPCVSKHQSLRARVFNRLPYMPRAFHTRRAHANDHAPSSLLQDAFAWRMVPSWRQLRFSFCASCPPARSLLPRCSSWAQSRCWLRSRHAPAARSGLWWTQPWLLS
jgi:hypothetical protein